ncbi:MAG TPA: hypothetical protein PLH94_07600 [Fimbriimonadaceae bacterium]|nr:hypothetical protein [Fimbriimonadaceae bacterium]
MKITQYILVVLTAFVALFATGCGGGSGALGRNSDIEIILEVRRAGDDADNLILSVSPNDGAWDSSQAANDFQGQNWITRQFSRSDKRFTFRTNSNQVPYRVFIGNEANFDIDARITIRVDGTQQYLRNLTVVPGAPSLETRIFRNNVE